MPVRESSAGGEARDDPVREGSELLGRYEQGAWPSHVTEIKKTAYPIEAYARGLSTSETQWHAGSARVRYVSSGIISRRTKDGTLTETHFRVWQPSGQIYRTEQLRKLLDLADRYGLGLIETTGQQGCMIVSIKPELADEAVDGFRAAGTDIGGTGDTIREFACCVGPALCEYALYDSLAARDYFLTHPKIYEWMPEQMFPFKLKMKFSACPMDCARAAQRADFSFIGFWEGAPQIDLPLLRRRAERGDVDVKRLVERCPSGAIAWDGEKKELKIDGSRCAKSMNCIRSAFPAIKPGRTRKIGLLVGGKAKGRFGPKMGRPVVILDDYRHAADFAVRLIELWAEASPHKDRLGDALIKLGYKKVMGQVRDALPAALQGEQPPQPRIVNSPLLSDEERQRYADWARGVSQAYFGGGR